MSNLYKRLADWAQDTMDRHVVDSDEFRLAHDVSELIQENQNLSENYWIANKIAVDYAEALNKIATSVNGTPWTAAAALDALGEKK